MGAATRDRSVKVNISIWRWRLLFKYILRQKLAKQLIQTKFNLHDYSVLNGIITGYYIKTFSLKK